MKQKEITSLLFKGEIKGLDSVAIWAKQNLSPTQSLVIKPSGVTLVNDVAVMPTINYEIASLKEELLLNGYTVSQVETLAQKGYFTNEKLTKEEILDNLKEAYNDIVMS